MNLWATDYLAFSFFCALCMSSIIYFIVPKKWKFFAISFSCFVFLFLVSPFSCLWLSISSLIVVWGSQQRHPKIALSILIISTVFLLTQYFSKPAGMNVLPNSLMFLGIAYYSCRHIHVLVEAHKGKIHSISLRDYFHYSFFLPAIINGPIHRYPHFIRECQRRCFSWEDVFQGLERILYGFVKVVLVGDYILNTKIGLWLQAHLSHSFGGQVIDSANSWFILYAVFSGYTDVALGFAKIWGIRIEENFNYPLKATNLIEFWQRWHITLSQWCKDYIYLPVLAYFRSSALGVVLAMIGIGIWHELSLFYLFWACYQALGIILCRLYQRSDLLQLHKLPAAIRHILTRLATFSWLFSAKPVILLLLLKLGLGT